MTAARVSIGSEKSTSAVVRIINPYSVSRIPMKNQTGSMWVFPLIE